MHQTIRRALAVLAATPVAAASLLVTGPAAHAATMPLCTDPAKVLTEFDAFGLGHTRIAYATPSSTETDVCFQTDTNLTVTLAFKSNVSLAIPNVTTTPGTGGCATTLLNMTSPASVWLNVDENVNTRSVCIGKDGTTTTISVTTLPGVNQIPDLDVWFPANSYFQQVGTCIVLYAEAVAGTSPWQNYWDCYAYNRQFI